MIISSCAILAGSIRCLRVVPDAPRMWHGLAGNNPSRTALPRMVRRRAYACALAVGMSPDWSACQDRISAAVRPARGLMPRAGKMRLSSRLRYSARVRGLRSRSASHGLAYAASVSTSLGVTASGAGFHLPSMMLICCRERNSLASALASNVVGAVCWLPSGPWYLTWYLPDGSLRIAPKLRRVLDRFVLPVLPTCFLFVP